MARNPKLKAFVKYTSFGELVPNSLVIRKSKPKAFGIWKEVDMNLCCNPTTTTTTTTTII